MHRSAFLLAALVLLLGCGEDKDCTGLACESCNDLSLAQAELRSRIAMLPRTCQRDEDCQLIANTQCAGSCFTVVANASLEAARSLFADANAQCDVYTDKGCQLPPIPECLFSATACVAGLCEGRK